MTSITTLQPPLQLRSSSTDFQTDHIASAGDVWQILTGHPTGEVKVWQQFGGSPLQSLLLLAPPTHSPVRSLVVLDEQLLCCAHADGQFTLYLMHRQLPAATPDADRHPLPALMLQYIVHQAHCQGLTQCIKCALGLISVGMSGNILMWSKDQIKGMLQQADVDADHR